MTNLLPQLSYSSMRDFVQCKQKYYYRQILGIEPLPHTLPEAMKAGKMWDLCEQSRFGKLVDSIFVDEKPETTSKINALDRAMSDLEIITDIEKAELQAEVRYPLAEYSIIGYVDRAYPDHIVETKCSARPDFYTYIETIEHQVGTYLMANEAWEYVDIEIVRLPGLLTGKGKFTNEQPDQYEERCYQDIISRPSHYFIGFNRNKRIFGKRFWRSEFDLDRLWKMYRDVLYDLRDTVKTGRWYENTLSCYTPTPCVYLPIRKTGGVISEELFKYREKKEVKKDEGIEEE